MLSVLVLAQISDLATQLTERFGYLGLTVVMVVENVFPPIPSEVVLPLAGFQVSRGLLSFGGALIAATVGSLVGALVLYALGRGGGRPLILRNARLLRITPQRLERAEDWFDRHGAWVVLLGRLIPGARSVVSVPAGLACMPLWRFVGLTTLGSLAWNALLIAAGDALGANWTRVAEVIGPISTVVLGGAVVAVALWGAHRLWRARAAGR